MLNPKHPAHVGLFIGEIVLRRLNFVAAKLGTVEFGPFLSTALRFPIVLIFLFGFLRWPGKQLWSVLFIALAQGVGYYALVSTQST